jgi:serine-type D-Ala-D-Ala carboxypeptidase/endopeptidase
VARPGRACNRASAYLKPNIGIDGSPLAAAIKLAQQPRRDTGKTIRIGLVWMTTNKGIVWHHGLTDGYKELSWFYGRRRRGVLSTHP